MKTRYAPWRLATAAYLLLAAGCAPAYHWYPGCRVNCRYCPDPPLPYGQYSECVCHSHAGSEYLIRQPGIVEQPPAGESADDPPY